MRITHLLLDIAFCIALPLLATAQTEDHKDEIEMGTWNIKEGELQIDHSATEDDSIAMLYWYFLSDLLPNEPLNKYVVSLHLFTDDVGGVLGGMRPLNDGNTKWQIDLDIADIPLWTEDSILKLDYLHTLIHEFGHVISLNSSQIEPTEDEVQDDSRGYLTTEGYAKKGSYLNLFVSQFWEGEVLEEWDIIQSENDEELRHMDLEDFHDEFKDQFTTAYSAETPEEDIAESWTFFVMDSKPYGKQIRDQKVRFFYQFPELVKYRGAIRSKLEIIPSNYLKNYESIKHKIVLRQEAEYNDWD